MPPAWRHFAISSSNAWAESNCCSLSKNRFSTPEEYVANGYSAWLKVTDISVLSDGSETETVTSQPLMVFVALEHFASVAGMVILMGWLPAG